MSNYYNGYGHEQDWSAQLNDPSRRIAERGKRQAAWMERDIQDNARAAEKHISAVREKRQIEKEQRLSQNELRRNINHMFAQAEWNKKLSHVNKAKQQHENARKWQKDILQFTKTGAAAYAKYDQEREKAITQLWNDHTDRYGLNPNIIDQVNAVTRESWKNDMHSQGVYQDLKAKGMSDDLIRSLHGLGQYAKIAIANNHARSRAVQHGTFYGQLGNEELIIGNQTTTLNAAKASGDPVLYQEAMRLVDLKIDDINGGPVSAKVKETSGYRQIVENTKATLLREQATISDKRARVDSAKERSEIFKDLLGKPDPITGAKMHPGQAYLMMIERDAGGPNSSRDRKRAARLSLNASIIDGLPEGIWDAETIKQIRNYVFKPDGSEKEKSIGEHWSSEMFALDKAIKARDQHDLMIATAARAKYNIKKESFLAESYNLIYPTDGSEGLKGEALIERYSAALKNGYEDSTTLIQKAIALDGAGGINDKAGRLRVAQLIKQGVFIPSDFTTNLNLTPLAKVEMDALIAKHNRAAPTQGETGTAKILKAEVLNVLERKVPSKNSFSKIPGSTVAAQQLYQEAVTYYKAHINKHGYDTHMDALQYARDMIEKELNKPTSKWRVELNTATKQRDFVGFRANPGRDVQRVDIPSVVSAIQKDSSYIDTNAIIGQPLVNEYFQALNDGRGITDVPMALILENQTLVPSHEILERQRVFFNSQLEPTDTPIPEAPAKTFETINEYRNQITPKLQYKLSLQNPTNINEAYAGSNQPLPYIQKPVTFAQNIIPRVLGIGYNNIDNGSFDMDSEDYNLTDANISDVIELAQDQRLGAFKLSGQQIQKHLEASGLKTTDKFSAANQNKLFEVIFRSEGLMYWLPDLNRPLIDGTTIINPEDMQKLEDAYDALTQPFAPRSTAWVRPEFHQYLGVA